jgi:hypothetical protein
MIIDKYKQNFATYIYSIIVIMAFYSFGTFGLLNLYGLRNSFQFIIIIASFFGIVSILSNIKKKEKSLIITISIIIIGFLYYGVMLALIKGTMLNSLIQSILMIIVTLYLLFVDMKYIRIISKVIVINTFILANMGFIAFIAFLLNDNLLNEVDFSLYDSTIGSKIIYAKSWVEYLSFTSGDGFELFGTNITRVKSFCNEPSATIIHILAPVGLALLFSKRFIYISIVILLFNIFAIASLMAWITILGSVVIYFFYQIKNNLVKKLLIISSMLLILLLMSNINTAVSSILDIGNSLQNSASISLIAKKEGSITMRLLSFSTALNEFKNHPLGGSSYNTMTGHLLNVSLVGGILIFLIIGNFYIKMINYSILAFNNNKSLKYIRFAIAFISSVLLVSLFLSGYGWDRIPGVIMLMLFYRHLQYMSYSKINERLI